MTRPIYCAAYDCRSNSRSVPGMHFFRFPKNLAKAKLWMSIVKRDDLQHKAYQNHRLCSLHFRDKHIDQKMNRYRLLNDALPVASPRAGRSNTSTLTKNKADDLRLPIKSPNGNLNHDECAIHFETADLPGLDEHTFIVPTENDPIEIKEEFELIPSNQDYLDVENVREIDNTNGDENWDFEIYEILEPQTATDDDIDMPMSKRAKLEQNPINTSSPCTEQTVKQKKISVPKISNVNLSKNLSKTDTPSRLLKFDHREWQDEETQGFLKCLLIHKNEFKNLHRGSQHNFWDKMENILKAQGVLRHPTNSFKIYNKWNALRRAYIRLASCDTDLNNHPFMNDVKNILFDTVVQTPTVSNDLKSITKEHNREPANQSNAQKGWLRHVWLENDTRKFLKYMIDHRAEFCSNGLKMLFWKNMVDDLNKKGVMTYPATTDQLRMKWKLLMKNYKYVQLFEKEEQSHLTYIEEMKNILFNPLKPHEDSISIGLTSPFQTTRQKNIKSSKQSKSNNATSLSTTELKKIYWQKKIEGRELKLILLKKLFNGPNCNIVTNNFKVVTINQIKKPNNQV